MESDSTTAQAALQRILLAHRENFDVFQNHEVCGRRFPGYAEFRSSASRYVLVKRAKLWEANVYEYILFSLVDHLDESGLSDIVSFAEQDVVSSLEIKPNHMTSYVSPVIIAGSCDPDIPRLVKKTRFRKNLLGGLRGWIDLRLAVVDMTGRRVYTNSQGKVLKPTLENNAFRDEKEV